MQTSAVERLVVRSLGVQEYRSIWSAMREFTDARTSSTVDELWLVQHMPVFTHGQAGKAEHVLAPGDIPVVATDRGGQVTYHGPGQLVAYPLLDLRRRKLGVRELVTLLENTVIQLLAEVNLIATAKIDAPGVYVGECKIASLGLRVRRGCSFHGVSINVDMDLEPFLRINPCGYNELRMTQIAALETSDPLSLADVEQRFIRHFATALGLSHAGITVVNPDRQPD